MGSKEDVEIRIIPKSKEYESRDLQILPLIKDIIRNRVLPMRKAEYYRVDVEIKRKKDQTQDYLIAYLLRKDIYLTEIVKIDITSDFKVKNIEFDYNYAGDEEGGDSAKGFFEDGFDFVIGTPVDDIPTAKLAIDFLYDLFTKAGFRCKKLLGTEANLNNYQSYLTSNLMGFVNVGHGNPNGISLSDGFLLHSWFQGLSNQALKPVVVYFNSCLVHNDPLKSAIMHAGARTFIGGIVNLIIGSSEDVCKCFWRKILFPNTRMDDSLHQCEKDKYPTIGAHGIVGVLGRFGPETIIPKERPWLRVPWWVRPPIPEITVPIDKGRVIKIDLYSDRGVLLKSDVDLSAISPLKNAAMQGLISLTKRTVAVNLAGIEGALKTGKVAGGRRQIKGRELNYDVVANANAIADKIKALLQVTPGDDTNVRVLGGGKHLLVQIPTARVDVASEYVVGMTAAAAATVEAIVQEFKVNMMEAPMVHAAVWGEYPQTVGMNGGNVASVLNIPQNDEGLGFSMRNIMANHFASITKKNAMNAAALASIFEQIGEFEMGNAYGIFERHQLLGMAYQGLNANNLVYETIKANGKTGTIGTVVETIVATAREHDVIKVDKKLPSGYVLYEVNDVSYWNAYCAAGTLAATMVNCGSLRGAQAVSSTLLYFNDIIEKETALPGCDFGRVMGTAVGFSFFSHSIYGGGGPGVFNGNHIVTRHSRGFAIPCVAAAIALDAGTQMFTPEMTSGLVGAIYGEIKEFREPIISIAEAV